MDVGVARSHHWCARRRVGCHAKQVITIWQLQLAVVSPCCHWCSICPLVTERSLHECWSLTRSFQMVQEKISLLSHLGAIMQTGLRLS